MAKVEGRGEFGESDRRRLSGVGDDFFGLGRWGFEPLMVLARGVGVAETTSRRSNKRECEGV